LIQTDWQHRRQAVLAAINLASVIWPQVVPAHKYINDFKGEVH